MPATGAISERVQELIPATWAALYDADGAQEQPFAYGPERLQARIDLVKAKLFGDDAFDEGDEKNYNIVVQEYLGKLVALQLIPAGIEWWMNASMQVTSTGHGDEETATYPDRVKALKELQAQLQLEIASDFDEIEHLLADYGYVVRRRSASFPRSSYDGKRHITKDPHTDPAAPGATETYRPLGGVRVTLERP